MADNTMLYKFPGPHPLQDGSYDYIVVDDDKIDEHIAQGWHRTTAEAKAAHEADQKLAADKAAKKRKSEE